MKLTALISLILSLQAGMGLTDHFFNRENLSAMGILVTLYFIAFAVGDLFGESDSLTKKDIVKGFVLGLFLGVLGSVIVYHTDRVPPVVVYLVFAAICIAPNQTIKFIQDNIAGILDKIKNRYIK